MIISPPIYVRLILHLLCYFCIQGIHYKTQWVLDSPCKVPFYAILFFLVPLLPSFAPTRDNHVLFLESSIYYCLIHVALIFLTSPSTLSWTLSIHLSLYFMWHLFLSVRRNPDCCASPFCLCISMLLFFVVVCLPTYKNNLEDYSKSHYEALLLSETVAYVQETWLWQKFYKSFM